ncbi:MAG: CBS domain-containing protein [Actinomycetota bacterium]|nr:CBS domain-containing protein [Actinomycetota bacterium]
MAQTIRQLMTPDPVTLPPSATLVEAALAMRGAGTGDVVVTLDGQARAIVTDRDIVIRAVAEGLDPGETTLAEVANEQLVCLTPEQSVDEAVQLMRRLAVRRLPVVDEDDQLVGILSLGDLAVELDPDSALADISAAPPNE